MKLKPLLFIAGAAGAVAAVVKSRGGQVAEAVPQPVKSAAQQAGATVQKVVENAPEPVKQAVDKVTPGDTTPGPDEQSKERYEPPAEALAQEPAEAGGPPSDATKVHEAPRIASEPGDQLNTPEHALPEGAVMPDTSDDDPLVRQQTKAAMGDAGAIGGNVDEMAAGDAGFPDDPADRAVVEGSGDEVEEAFEAREGTERGNRETE
jgi:hypothetical protein